MNPRILVLLSIQILIVSALMYDDEDIASMYGKDFESYLG